MTWFQKQWAFTPFSRGFHLITKEVEKNLPIENYRMGIVNLFLQHTSASLTLNENADPTVRKDFESHFNQMVPENAPYYLHTYEGSDDMPAHLKSSILGQSLNIPIIEGKLGLGTWQGIYLCEHRNQAGSRRILATIQGEKYL